MFSFSLCRPEAVTLVDAFDYSDYDLNSALGRYDGNVYEDLYKRAQASRLNEHQVFEANSNGEGWAGRSSKESSYPKS